MQTWVYSAIVNNSVLGITHHGFIGLWDLALPSTTYAIDQLLEITPACLLPKTSIQTPYTFQKAVMVDHHWILLGNSSLYQLILSNASEFEVSLLLNIKDVSDVCCFSDRIYISTTNGEISEYANSELVCTMCLCMKPLRIAVCESTILVGSCYGEVACINWIAKEIKCYLYPSLGMCSKSRIALTKHDTISTISLISNWAV